MVDRPADPYRIGGFLLDANGDGHPDDLAVRIVLPPDPALIDTPFWCALIDLAARLGLETAGLPDRVVLASGDPLPPDCIPIFVLPGEGSAEHTSGGVVLRTVEDASALATAGVSPVAIRDAAPERPPAITDLGKLFTPSGLLRDRDGDHLPDGTRLVLLLPDPCPPAIGVAAIEFAARLGLESGGIDLPLAVAAGTEFPAEVFAVDLTGSTRALPGEVAQLRLVDGRLELRGDAGSMATLVRFLASTWPVVDAETTSPADVVRVVEAIKDLASGVPLSSADSPAVFALEWEERWEVDRVRDLVRDELIPVVAGTGEAPIDLLVLVSESPEIRQALETEVSALVASALPGTGDVRVRVRSAYKAGLSWVREDVIPALSRLGGIDRVELRYAPVPATEDTPPRLDLPIRWLQELYPGDELLASALGLPLAAVDLVEQTTTGGAIYETVAFRDGSPIWRDSFSPRWYELPYLSLDPSRGSVLVSTGGVQATRGGAVVFDRDVPTDCDRFWVWYREVVLPRVGEHVREDAGGPPHLADQPYFAALRIDAWVSEPNEPLGLREELDSAAEALHEDVYFGSLDWLGAYGKSLGGDELTGPGAILPFIHVTPGQAPRARVALTGLSREAPPGSLSTPGVRVTGLAVGPAGLAGLDVTLDLPPGSDSSAVGAHLRAVAAGTPAAPIDGTSLPTTIHVGAAESISLNLPVLEDGLAGIPPSPEGPPADRILFGNDLPPLLARLRERPGVTMRQIGQSFQGRPLWGIEVVAPMPTSRWSSAKLSLRKPTFFVIGRHHANEVASTTAAFLLAERLTTDPTWRARRDAVNVVILPFANPDGAALHQELVAEHPTWKHHAARYNAVGLESAPLWFDEQTPFGEARARRALWERWLPDVIVDNHGVPSHEWSQHFAGFGSPPRFGTCYWMVQALIYGIITHVDAADQTALARELRRRLAQAIKESPEIDVVNRLYGHRYQRWGSSRVPARFPADVEDDFLCYVTVAAPDPTSRNFAVRFPATTTLDWVTEVPDETAHGAQLALTAQAHLLANDVTLRLMAELAPPVERIAERRGVGELTIRLHRRRPLRIAEPPRTGRSPSEEARR